MFSRRREVGRGGGGEEEERDGRKVKISRGARAAAGRNAGRIVALEERLGLHVEPALQRALLPRRRLVAVLNVAYVTLNVALTVGWLMTLFRRRDPAFHRLRRAAVLATLGQLKRNTVALERSVEYGGPAVRHFSTDMRFTIANMTAEFGGLNGIFAGDEVTASHVLMQTPAGETQRVGGGRELSGNGGGCAERGAREGGDERG